VPQPLSVYYYLEPGAVYAPLFAYLGGGPWARRSMPVHSSQDRPTELTGGRTRHGYSQPLARGEEPRFGA